MQYLFFSQDKANKKIPCRIIHWCWPNLTVICNCTPSHREIQPAQFQQTHLYILAMGLKINTVIATYPHISV